MMMVDEKLNTAVGKNLVQGKADPINSAFHLTYNMVLNLLRVEQIDPEYILERSFFQFQNFSSIPEICARVSKAAEDHDALTIPRESEVESYYKIKTTIENLKTERQSFMTRPNYIMPFLQPGRLVQVKNGEDDFGWGVVLNYKRTENKKDPTEAPTITVDVILIVSEDTSAKKITTDLKPPIPGEASEPVVVPILLKLIQDISSVRLKLPSDLKPLEQRLLVMKMVEEAQKRVQEDQFLLDPVRNMKIKDPTFVEIVDKLEKFSSRLDSHKLHEDSKRDALVELYSKKVELKKELKLAETDLKAAKSVLQLNELKCYKRVLRRLGYATSQDVIEKKGRVACELSAADELLITEMLFNGVFNNLSGLF